MARTEKTASEIRRLIQARIYASADCACRDCHANQVHWHAPDDTGCNWELHSYNGPASCAGAIDSIVAELQKQINLVPQAATVS